MLKTKKFYNLLILLYHPVESVWLSQEVLTNIATFYRVGFDLPYLKKKRKKREENSLKKASSNTMMAQIENQFPTLFWKQTYCDRGARIFLFKDLLHRDNILALVMNIKKVDLFLIRKISNATFFKILRIPSRNGCKTSKVFFFFLRYLNKHGCLIHSKFWPK